MASLSPKTSTLNLRLAKHLARRTTFAFSRSFVNSLVGLTPSAAMDVIFGSNSLTMDQPIDPLNGSPWINDGSEPSSDDFALREYVSVWWLHEALMDETIESKLTFFLHQSFAIHSEAGNSAEFFDYLAYLRQHAYGSLKELAKKITVDNTMLSYLDGAYSWAGNPNENFGREFLELYTIGKGPQIGPGDYTFYTEYDIQQAARVFTGWQYGDRLVDIDTDTGIPMGHPRPESWAHDNADKILSDKFGNAVITGQDTPEGMIQEISDFVEVVFAQDQTAKNFSKKLYRFFVGRIITPEIETDIIIPLATTLKNSGYNIEIALKALLSSKHFYDEDDANSTDNIVGSIVKSPLDNILQTIKMFEIATPDPIGDPSNHYDQFWRYSVMHVMFEKADLQIFQPYNVAGYPAYYDELLIHRAWFNSSTVISRYKTPEMFLTGEQVISWGDLGGVIFNPVPYIDTYVSDPADPEILVNELAGYIFPEAVDNDRLEFYKLQLLDMMTESAWADAWLEYTQTSDESVVKPAIDALITALLYSQEYQLS